MKTKLILSAFIALLSTSVILMACKKEVKGTNENQTELKEMELFSIAAPIGGLTPPANYCSMCGSSAEKNYGCFTKRTMDGGTLEVCESAERSGCGVALMDDKIEEYELNLLGFNASEIYRIRDSFMIISSKGQNYITYFYSISGRVAEFSTLTTSNFMQHYNFAVALVDRAQRIIDGNNTEIIFDSQFVIDAKALINYYKTVDATPTFQGQLNTIEADMNLMENMTRTQVLAEFGLVSTN